MFFTYILYSRAKDKYYVGHTNDLQRRIYEHNLKHNLGTDDWELKFQEPFEARGEAMIFEQHIKSKKRRSYIESLISSAG